MQIGMFAHLCVLDILFLETRKVFQSVALAIFIEIILSVSLKLS